MKKVCFALLLAGIVMSCSENKKEEKTDNQPMVKDATTKPPPSEFADAKYMDMGKQMLQQFEKGDINGWMNSFAENARYYWSGGDSLIGKKAITDYWKNRRGNVIESIKFNNDIWLPLKVNVPQKGPDAPGIWLMSWYQVDAKYKTGKELNFWVHTDYHFNDANKIDVAVQYIDRAPINEATKGK